MKSHLGAVAFAVMISACSSPENSPESVDYILSRHEDLRGQGTVHRVTSDIEKLLSIRIDDNVLSQTVTSENSTHFFVNSSNAEVNIRNSPSLDAERIGNLKNNTLLLVSESRDAWLKLSGYVPPKEQHPFTKEAWVHSSLLSCESSQVKGVCTVTSKDGEANIREADNSIILVLKNKDKVLIDKTENNWARLILYVKSENIVLSDASQWVNKNLTTKLRIVESVVDFPPDATILRQVPYRAQRNNRNEPGATCGITSASMLLLNHSVKVEPDDLYETYGKAAGQSPSALAELYRKELGNGHHTYNGTFAEVRSFLDKGQPVVMHGWLTYAGHVVLAVGYDAKGFYFHDPAGRWLGEISSFDTSKNAGRFVHYSYVAMMRKFPHPTAGLTSLFGDDGDLWISTAQ